MSNRGGRRRAIEKKRSEEKSKESSSDDDTPLIGKRGKSRVATPVEPNNSAPAEKQDKLNEGNNEKSQANEQATKTATENVPNEQPSTQIGGKTRERPIEIEVEPRTPTREKGKEKEDDKHSERAEERTPAREPASATRQWRQTIASKYPIPRIYIYGTEGGRVSDNEASAQQEHDTIEGTEDRVDEDVVPDDNDSVFNERTTSGVRSEDIGETPQYTIGIVNRQDNVSASRTLLPGQNSEEGLREGVLPNPENNKYHSTGGYACCIGDWSVGAIKSELSQYCTGSPNK